MSDLIETESIDDYELEVPTDEELFDFKNMVAEWTKMDDQIRKLNIAVRERRVLQKTLGEKIQSFMKTYSYDTLNTKQGKIHHSVRKTKQPIKINDIKEVLKEKAHLTGEELLKEIFEKERPIIEKTSIRRVIPKVSMNLDI
jgi:hypothetical protein